MIIALFPHSKKKEALHIASSVCEYLTARETTVLARDEIAEQIGASSLSSVDPQKIDYILSLGGDGNILSLVHEFEGLDAAVMGINLGYLGFMADIPVDEIYPSLQELLDGEFEIDERLTLQGTLPNNETCLAVNDIFVHRGQNPSLIELAIHVDGRYLNTFIADGVVLSTPNGSTAYSLAAGGPILTPNLNAIVLTPISPHTISNRPIVLDIEQELQIQFLSEFEPVDVSADGVTHHQLKTGDVLKVTRSDKVFRLVNFTKRDYFQTLRTKLGWSGKLR